MINRTREILSWVPYRNNPEKNAVMRRAVAIYRHNLTIPAGGTGQCAWCQTPFTKRTAVTQFCSKSACRIRFWSRMSQRKVGQGIGRQYTEEQRRKRVEKRTRLKDMFHIIKQRRADNKLVESGERIRCPVCAKWFTRRHGHQDFCSGAGKGNCQYRFQEIRRKLGHDNTYE